MYSLQNKMQAFYFTSMVCKYQFKYKSLLKLKSMRCLLFYVATLFLVTSCSQIEGSGNIVKQKRETAVFTGVKAGGAFEVEIKTGPITVVIVESDDNILPYIKTEVVEGVLEISNKRKRSFGNAHVKVFITTPTLNFIKASGAAKIMSVDEIKNVDRIKMELSGAANIKAMVNAPDIHINASGASHIELTGRTRNFNAKASGSSAVKCSSLQSENSQIAASGASTIHTHASVKIEATASGAATIYHLGTNNIKQKISGAARIQSKN